MLKKGITTIENIIANEINFFPAYRSVPINKQRRTNLIVPQKQQNPNKISYNIIHIRLQL
jgi:hypothetical protein